MRIFTPPIIDSFQLLKVPFTYMRNTETFNQKYVVDTDLTEQDSFYLVRQRMENLREKIDKTLEETIELQDLQNKYQQEISDIQSIPENLGVSSKIDMFKAALEAKRANRNDNENYDGEVVDFGYSNVNQSYIKLFADSWLNKKSFRFLDKDKKKITWRDVDISIFDVFAKEDIGAVFHRCNDLVTSPIYENMQQIEEDHYLFSHQIECFFKDKSAKFLVPLREFTDIPMVALHPPSYIEFTMVLPVYAHERKRYFKKENAYTSFVTYLQKLEVSLSPDQKTYLLNLRHSSQECIQI